MGAATESSSLRAEWGAPRAPTRFSGVCDRRKGALIRDAVPAGCLPAPPLPDKRCPPLPTGRQAPSRPLLASLGGPDAPPQRRIPRPFARRAGLLLSRPTAAGARNRDRSASDLGGCAAPGTG